MGNAKFSKKMECKPNEVRYNPVVHKVPKKEERQPAQIQIELDEEFLYRKKIEEKREEEEEESRVLIIDIF